LLQGISLNLFHAWLPPGGEESGLMPKPFKRFLFSPLTLSTWLKPGVKETQNILVGHFISHDFWRKAL
jgi:hypothetical protein